MKLEWTLTKLQLATLKPLDNNPRTITEEKFDKLKKSIDDLGTFRPLVVDFDRRTILAGNQRFRALLEESNLHDNVDCMLPNRGLTPAEREKIIVMDNAHYGQWDMDVLANEFDLSLIQELDLDIRIPEVLIPEDLSDKNKEIDTDNFGNDLEHTCPKCGFEFND